MNNSIYDQQARASVLELLVIEVLAAHPDPYRIIESFTARAAEQQAIQASIGTEPALRDAFRMRLASILSDVHLRIP